MWRHGYTANGAEYCAKVYEQGSRYGIGGGRISKLQIKMHGVEIYNYDRGEDVPATTLEAREALAEILAKYV